MTTRSLWRANTSLSKAINFGAYEKLVHGPESLFLVIFCIGHKMISFGLRRPIAALTLHWQPSVGAWWQDRRPGAGPLPRCSRHAASAHEAPRLAPEVIEVLAHLGERLADGVDAEDQIHARRVHSHPARVLRTLGVASLGVCGCWRRGKRPKMRAACKRLWRRRMRRLRGKSKHPNF